VGAGARKPVRLTRLEAVETAIVTLWVCAGGIFYGGVGERVEGQDG
jgi:hypothetical protein